MVHTSGLVIGNDEPTTPEQTANEASISHHSGLRRPARELYPNSTSSSQSTLLFTSTTRITAFPRLRLRHEPHLPSVHSSSPHQLYLPTTGLLFLPFTMAHWRPTCSKHINGRGDIFYTYGISSASTSDQVTAEQFHPSNDSDSGDIRHGQGEELSGQIAGLRLEDADAGTREHRIRRHSEHDNSNTTRTYCNLQWEIDNLPIDGTRPYSGRNSAATRTNANSQWETDNLPTEGTDPIGEEIPHEGGLSDEYMVLIALERAYRGLELPIMDDINGEGQQHMVQLAVPFIFKALPWLNHIRDDLENLGDLYEGQTLAKQFYIEYGVAIWGLGAGDGGELDDQRLARLEIFFNALRTQNSTRDEAEATGDRPLRQLLHLRRASAAASRVVPRGTDPVASLPEFYAALEIQKVDTWVKRWFPRAVAEMASKALSHVRDPVSSFPCALPSSVLVEGVIDRIVARYGRKLWLQSNARPSDVTTTLFQYIITLMKTNMTTDDHGENPVKMLDSLLGLEDGDAEERRTHMHDEPHASLKCPSAQEGMNESCLGTFASRADLLSHLSVDPAHEWGEEVAEDFLNNC